MSKDKRGAQRRLEKALTHNLLTQSKIGRSKHEAKQAARQEWLAKHGTLQGWNPAKADGIYSRGTMATYIRAVSGLARYAAEHGIKRLADLTAQMGADYLRAMHAEGQSAWSIATAAAASNKAMGWDLSPAALGLPSRRKQDITRSRVPRAHDTRDFTLYADQIAMAKATGIRRQSMLVIKPNDCVRDSQGTVVGVSVIEQGGRHRIAPVLVACRADVTRIVDQAIQAHGEDAPIFNRYDLHIDNHRYRAEYAGDLLHQLEDERASGRPLFGGAFGLSDYAHLRGRDAKRKPVTQGHDTDILAAVSGALGHPRIDVVLRHYLYCY